LDLAAAPSFRRDVRVNGFVLSGTADGAGAVPGVFRFFALAAIMGAGNGVFHPVDFAILDANASPKRLGHAYPTHGAGDNLGYAIATAAKVHRVGPARFVTRE